MTPPTPNPPAASSAPTELDLRHLRCPLPVLRTRKQLARMAPGERVRVLCTDPLAGLDIPHLVQETGNLLADQAVCGDTQAFVIVKR